MKDDRRHKEEEFLERLRKHEGILHKICLIYSGDQLAKEDLCQEIILQLWKSYPGFAGRSAFSTWMYRVALNTAIGLTKRPPILVSLSKSPAASFDPEEQMELSEEVRILYRAISELPKVDKAIILLWLEERPYSEIAQIVGISEKNVSVKLVRIKARLADRIKKYE